MVYPLSISGIPKETGLAMNNQANASKQERRNTPNRDDLKLSNVGHVTSNAKLSHFGALPYSNQDDS